MGDLKRISLSGQARGLATPSADGPIFLTCYDGKNLGVTVLTVVDLMGSLMWSRRFDGKPSPPRIGDGGAVWIMHRGPNGAIFSEVDSAGMTLRSVFPEQDQGERVGAFVLLDGGLLVAWLPDEDSRDAQRDPTARVALHSGDGATVWSTEVSLGAVAYVGVVEIGARTGGKREPKEPWLPARIAVSQREPLLVSGDRVAATFIDPSSGLGATFFLVSDTGLLVHHTAPEPDGHKASLGGGNFLIGHQGYGAFTTRLHDRFGATLSEWPTHAMIVTDRRGDMRGPEHENVMPSRSCFVGLDADGVVRAGPALTGYSTSYPSIDDQGTAVFWRDGRLLTVDAGLAMQVVLLLEDEQRSVISRTLLLDRGQVAFVLHDELLIYDDAGIGPLDAGAWPCGDAGLRGNPVVP